MGPIARRRAERRAAGGRPLALVMVGSRHLAKRTCRLIEGLAMSGYAPVVLSIPRGSWGISGMEEPQLVSRRGMVTLRGQEQTPATWPPGVVVCAHWSVLPAALALKALLGSRVIYDEHDDYEMLALEANGSQRVNELRARLVAAVHARCLPHVDLVTCIRMSGGRLKTQLQQRAPRVVELHNYPSRRWQLSTSTAPGGTAAPKRESPVALVYVGGLWDVKGGVNMLAAVAELRRDPTVPQVELHVFGSGDPKLKQQAQNTAGVVFHGESTWNEITGFLIANDCVGLALLAPTPRYQMVSTNCHKLYEYMAAAVPVVATDVGDLRQIVTAAGAGWVVSADYTADDLADQLRDIICEPAERHRRGAAAAAAIQKGDMSWEGEWRKVEQAGVLTPTPAPMAATWTAPRAT